MDSVVDIEALGELDPDIAEGAGAEADEDRGGDVDVSGCRRDRDETGDRTGRRTPPARPPPATPPRRPPPQPRAPPRALRARGVDPDPADAEERCREDGHGRVVRLDRLHTETLAPAEHERCD